MKKVGVDFSKHKKRLIEKFTKIEKNIWQQSNHSFYKHKSKRQIQQNSTKHKNNSKNRSTSIYQTTIHIVINGQKSGSLLFYISHKFYPELFLKIFR